MDHLKVCVGGKIQQAREVYTLAIESIDYLNLRIPKEVLKKLIDLKQILKRAGPW